MECSDQLTVPRYSQISPMGNDNEEFNAFVAPPGATWVLFVSTHGNSHIPARRPINR